MGFKSVLFSLMANYIWIDSGILRAKVTDTHLAFEPSTLSNTRQRTKNLKRAHTRYGRPNNGSQRCLFARNL